MSRFTTHSYGHDDGDGSPDVVVGGHIEVNHVGRTLLAQALPPVGHVRAESRSRPASDRSSTRSSPAQ
ncbi:hypothetical protein AB0K18_05525 [Nonomuraea sp. NPDC049421]|uniref:hypothetical protein n=1 Tax=Nonomuraea sp. NPDC049421 TaxID=3155275 RepID=UPI0034299E5B